MDKMKDETILVKNYRSIQKWNHWLTQKLGKSILETEENFLSKILTNRYGNYVLLLGVPQQEILLQKCSLVNHILLSPLHYKHHKIKFIEGEFHELPILPGSMDLVIIPHVLEFIDNPHRFLLEACRVVKPEGDIIIFGFNPMSFWGLKKWLVKEKQIPWSGNFMSPQIIKNWLTLADFELIRQDMLLFRPPLHQESLYNKLKVMDWIGSKLNAFIGGVYVITAKAKIIPLTPIKLHWKQNLSNIPAITSIPNPTSNKIAFGEKLSLDEVCTPPELYATKRFALWSRYQISKDF